MPFYHQLGKIPSKRHIIYKQTNGSFYYEQLFGTEGFNGMSSLLYHLHRPTQVINVGEGYNVSPEIAVEKNIKSLRLNGFRIKPEQDFLKSRKTLLCNSHYLFSSWPSQKQPKACRRVGFKYHSKNIASIL